MQNTKESISWQKENHLQNRELQTAYIEVQFQTESIYLKYPKATVDITSFCWAYQTLSVLHVIACVLKLFYQNWFSDVYKVLTTINSLSKKQLVTWQVGCQPSFLSFFSFSPKWKNFFQQPPINNSKEVSSLFFPKMTYYSVYSQKVSQGISNLRNVHNSKFDFLKPIMYFKSPDFIFNVFFFFFWFISLNNSEDISMKG